MKQKKLVYLWMYNKIKIKTTHTLCTGDSMYSTHFLILTLKRDLFELPDIKF